MYIADRKEGIKTVIDSCENDYKKGIVCIIVSAFCFSLMSLFIRLSGDLPTLQKCFFRNVVAMFIAMFSIKKSGEGFSIGKGNLPFLFMRALGGTVGLLCNFYATDNMAISDASMLNKLSPFFAIIFSCIILKEKANAFEWISVVVAFIGAMFIVKPAFSMDIIPAVAGVLGGCGAGFAYTFVRKLGKRGERNMIIVLFFSTFSTLVTLPYILLDYTPMSGKQLLCLILCGTAAAGGQIFITRAYSYAPAKEISVYDFSIVIFTAVFGYMFLNQSPDLLSFAGYVIIIGTAVLKWYVSNRKSRKE